LYNPGHVNLDGARSQTVISQELIRYLKADEVKRALLAVGASHAKDICFLILLAESETGFGFRRAWVVAEMDMDLRSGAFRSTRFEHATSNP
jgi:hypothetical protein